jgi:N-acetylglutamate synthase-like GNAT family acetyltransferase
MTVGGVFPIRASGAVDFSSVRDLLIAARLPIEDLNSAPALRFWVAEDQGRIIGAIGLEARGTAGLLRSLVVEPSHRQRGLGSTCNRNRRSRAVDTDGGGIL